MIKNNKKATWVKTGGMSSPNKKKKIECTPLPKNINPAGLFINHANEFYTIYRKNIGQGINDHAWPENMPYLPSLGANLTNLHFAFELILKALIALHLNKFDKQIYGHHRLIKLLQVAANFYPLLNQILNNQEYVLILEELSNHFNNIRYGQVAIFTTPNNKKGHKHKKHFEELVESTDSIYKTMLKTFNLHNS